MLNKYKNHKKNSTLVFYAVKCVLLVPSIKLDEWQNKTWNFSLRSGERKGNLKLHAEQR